MRFTFYIILAALLLTNCSSPAELDHIADETVKKVLKKGIDAAGGLENWKNEGGYTFDKRSILYLEDGSIESKSSQVVSFKNHPTLEGTIQWNNQTDTVDTKVVFRNGEAVKYIADIPQNDEVNQAALLSFYGAHMVMNLPFKLLDPGVELSYGGQQKIFDKNVEVLIADYNKDQPNHNKTHRWWHYFDAESYEYIGYKVLHPPTFAMVENISSTVHEGIVYSTDRITWRVDSLDNKQFIRAKFAYDNFRTAD